MARQRIALVAVSALALALGGLLLHARYVHSALRADMTRWTTARLSDPGVWDFRRHYDDFGASNAWYWHCASSDSFHGDVYLIQDRLGRRVITEYDIRMLNLMQEQIQRLRLSERIDLAPR